MTKRERHRMILEMIQVSKDINIKDLARSLNVSEMTIRRDLKELESLESQSLHESYSLISAIKREHNHKVNIGLKASKLLKDGDVIFIDTGSTSVQLVDHLLDFKGLTVQTCNVEVLTRLAFHQNITLFFTGGTLHTKSQMCESDESLAYLKGHKSKYAFISASGIDQDLGLSCENYYEVKTKQIAIQNSKYVVLLIDSSKFDHIAPASFAEVSDLDCIVTDDGISDDWRRYLESMNIKLILSS